MANKVDLWRYKEKLELGTNDSWVELDNGNIINSGADINDNTFDVKYTFHCAQYRVSDRNITSVDGMNDEDTIVVAVKHRPNFDYDSYRARFRKKYYIVTYIVPDTAAIVSYDLLSLKSVIKNGGSSGASDSFGGGTFGD